MVKYKVPYTHAELKTFFKEFNLFVGDGVDFDQFKKIFFPWQYIGQDEPDDATEKNAKEQRIQFDCHEADQSQKIEKRL